MDPRLEQFIRTERDAVTMTLTFLLHGVLVTGVPSHPSRWGDDVNAWIDEVQTRGSDADPLTFDFLRQTPTDAEEVHGYLTLRDVTVQFATGAAFTVPFIRVDLEHVSAWWVRPPEPVVPDDVADEAGEASPREYG
jgi:hypothetical protein